MKAGAAIERGMDQHFSFLGNTFFYKHEIYTEVKAQATPQTMDPHSLFGSLRKAAFVHPISP